MLDEDDVIELTYAFLDKIESKGDCNLGCKEDIKIVTGYIRWLTNERLKAQDILLLDRNGED